MVRVLTFAMIASLAGGGSSLVRLQMPTEDPGPPFYARVGLQIFDDGQWVAIPFYRSPSCIPADFNLLGFFHFPGPNGPGAFACPLLMSGFLLIEPDAPLGTFPRRVELSGTEVPVWFVPSSAFAAAAADGQLTIAELAMVASTRGIASSYHETLHPRPDDHLIVITTHGILDDGRSFDFNVTQIGEDIKSLHIVFESQ